MTASFILSFLSVGFNLLQKKYFDTSRIHRTGAFVINYVIKLFIMVLVMSMSGYVCIAVILGMSLGQILCEHYEKLRNSKTVDMDNDESLI